MPAAIHVLTDAPAVRFAARELSRYLKLATGRAVPISRRPRDSARDGTFRLGVCEDLGIKRPAGVTADDDWIRIQHDAAGKGYLLTGSNPRSVLFAVYRYLRECGFRWVRPGKRGEIVPRLRGRSPIVKGVKVDERASYKFRSITIEGACGERHVRDLIDWMAKHAMNGYFIQFHYGTIFFKRWHEHRGSKYLKPEPLTGARLAQAVGLIERDIELRGMSFERMGHGWTCAALGISTEGGWDKEDTSIVPPERRGWIAEVNGKREFWGGVSLNTQLNYGDPAVRGAVTDAIVKYAGEHPEVNLLHFWLADGTNNHDERPESAASRPSDFYVDMLNSLDEKLAAAGLPTRIVFLVYVDLLWAPQRATIRNPDRFVLMFAPITRGYKRSFLEGPDTPAPGGGEKKAEYVRNKLTFPKSPALNVEYLNDWFRDFRGDAFDFDYHAIWACYYDPNMFTIGRTLHKDIQGLHKLGVHGLNSCQNQRMSFPHNLLLDVMARTLWDKRRKLADIVEETFADAFGKDGDKAAAFFDRMSKLWEPMFDALYLPTPDEKRIARTRRNLPKIRGEVESIRPVVVKNLARAARNGAVWWSWKYLDVYLRVLDRLLPAVEAYANADPSFRVKLEAALDVAWRDEKTIHPALDVYMLAGVLGWRANELDGHLKTLTEAAATSPTTQPAGV